MAGTIKSNIRNCTESAIATYSTSGVPFTTASVFSKTFTADNDFVFNYFHLHWVDRNDYLINDEEVAIFNSDYESESESESEER